mgnify:FL=1
MFELLTPENLPATLTAVSLIITAVGGVVLYRVQKEPPKAGSQDAAAVALAENTRASVTLAANMGTMTGQLGDNMRMFSATLEVVKAMAHDIAEARRAAEASRDHLAAIRDALNRRAP